MFHQATPIRPWEDAMTATAVQTHRWSREEYERMVSAGVFHPEERLELVDGEVFEMAPQSSRHATAIRLAGEVLRMIFARGYDIRTQLLNSFINRDRMP